MESEEVEKKKYFINKITEELQKKDTELLKIIYHFVKGIK